MIRKKFIAFGLISMVLPVALQAQTIPAGHDPSTDTAATSSTTAIVSTGSSEPRLDERYPRYNIQCQDVLSIVFPLSPELDQTVTVQPDGYVNLQAVGSLYLKNLTIPEVVVALKSKYKGTLHDPIINVDLKDFQKPFFVATGQVGKPGQYDLRSDITVAEAIAVAGGLLQGAKGQVFLFRRISDGGYKVRKIQMNDILHGKHLEEDAMMQAGDMIYVPDKAIVRFREYVPYAFTTGSYLSPSSF